MRRDILHRAEETLMGCKRRVKSNDIVERESPVLQTIMYRRLLFCMPLQPACQNHVHSASSEIPAVLKDLSRTLANNQRTEIWKTKDLIKAQDGKVRCSGCITQIQRRG